MKRVALAAIAFASLAACQPRTELVFGVVTDVRAPDVLDTVQLQVTRVDNGFVEQQVSWDISGKPDLPFNLPGSFGVYSGGDETQLDVVLSGLKNNHVVVSRHAILSLVEGQTLFFRMGLTAGCIARTDCLDSESCVEGVCRDVHIDSRQLPPFTEEIVGEVTCNGGTTYLDTSTGAPMPPSPGAGSCDPALCSEGTCLNPPVVDEDTTRTVTGQQFTVFANASGTANRPDDLTSLAPRALVQDDQGNFTTIQGTGAADGTFVIPEVPSGEYYLAIGSTYYVTTSSSFDLSTVVNGRSTEMPASNATSITLNVTNLEPWQQGDWLEAYAADVATFWFDVANSNESTLAVPIADNATALTSYSITDQYAHDVDGIANLIQGDPFVVTQMRAKQTTGGLPYQSAERMFVASPFTQVDGNNTVVTGTFAEVAQQPLQASIAVTKLEQLTGFDGNHFNTLNPRSIPTPNAPLHGFALVGMPGGTQFGEYAASSDFMFFNPPAGADIPATQLTYGLAIPPGQLFGALYDLRTTGVVPFTLPGTTQPANLFVHASAFGDLATLPAELSYPLGPPTAATIGGHSLFDDQQVIESVIVAWNAPGVGHPVEYIVTVFELTASGQKSVATTVATLITTGTSVRMPPGVLQVGHFYALTLSSTSSAKNPDAPNRQSSPGADAQIASGLLVVIDSGDGSQKDGGTQPADAGTGGGPDASGAPPTPPHHRR